MAFRRPVKLDGGNLVNMTDAEVLLLQLEAIRQYGSSPSTSLTYSASNGNIGTIPDLRLTASAAVTGSSPWPTAGSASTLTVNYNHALLARSELAAAIPQREANSYTNFSYPVYLDGNNIRAMTTQDFWDTIITPAKDYLITSEESSSDNVYRSGTYTIDTTTSISGATLVDTNPIFSDTQANVTAFANGDLPEPVDQPLTVQNYYLHRYDPIPAFSFAPPVVQKIDSNDLQSMPSAMYSALAKDQMDWNVDNGVSSAGPLTTKFIEYRFLATAGAGAETLTSTETARGSAMINTYTSSSSTLNYQSDPTTYYAQNVPTGVPTAYATWNLVVGYIDVSGNRQ